MVSVYFMSPSMTSVTIPLFKSIPCSGLCSKLFKVIEALIFFYVFFNIFLLCFAATDLCSPSHTFFPSGLSPAGTLWGDSDPSRGGEAHHSEGQESAPASVWPAWLRVCPPHPGCQPQSHSSSLQQLQRAVPEQLGRSCDTGPHSARLGVVDAWPAKKKYSTDMYWIFFFQKMVVWDII